MDYINLTFAGLVTLGAVNVITFYKPNIDSRVKFALSLAVAFSVLFIPESLGTMLADKMKMAIGIALGASGVYKMAQQSGK